MCDWMINSLSLHHLNLNSEKLKYSTSVPWEIDTIYSIKQSMKEECNENKKWIPMKVFFLFVFFCLFLFIFIWIDIDNSKIDLLTGTSIVCFPLVPDSIYLLKVNNENTRVICELCSKLTINRPEDVTWEWLRSVVILITWQKTLISLKLLPLATWTYWRYERRSYDV